MLRVWMAAVLFMGTCGAASADSSVRLSGVKNEAFVASRITPAHAARGTTHGPDVPAALTELKRRAGQGDAQAQYELGLNYFRGQGVAQDFVEACMWLYLANAGATGDLSAKTVRARFEVSSLLTPALDAEAQRRAIAWQKKRTPGMPTPSKAELIDTFAKVDACSDAGHLARDAVEKTIIPRVQYYARLFFSERDIDDIGASLPAREKSAKTVFGWGCKSAFHTLAALPLPGEAGRGAR